MAPGRLSMMSCWFHASVNFWPIMRARMSEVPLGGTGRIMRMDFAGQPCAWAGSATVLATTAAARLMVRFMFPPAMWDDARQSVAA